MTQPYSPAPTDFSTNGHATNGHATNGHNGPAATGGTGRSAIDWTGYPALFQRVAPAAAPRAHAVDFNSQPFEQTAAINSRTGGIREAFLGFAQAALTAPGIAAYSQGMAARPDRPSESFATARALAAAAAFGFTSEELRRAGCGLYAGSAAVREDLRAVGFTDAQIDAARLTADDAGRPRAELAGCLVLPITDETGQLIDFLFVQPADDAAHGFGSRQLLYGAATTGMVAAGLQVALSRPAGRSDLVLVDDIAEGLLLQCRGLHAVAAVGGTGADLSPRRWEELARLGVTTVTLAFRRDEGHAAAVRDALVGALRARTAPEVYVANPFPAGERSAADLVRRFDREATLSALAARSLAFHDKDFGAAGRTRPAADETLAWTAPPRQSEMPSPTRWETSHTEPAPQPAPARTAAPRFEFAPIEPAPRAAEPRTVEREPAPVTQPQTGEPHFRTAFRRHAGELAAALPSEDCGIAQRLLEAVATAVTALQFHQAAFLIDGPNPWAYLPGAQPGSWPAPQGWAGYGLPSMPAAWAAGPWGTLNAWSGVDAFSYPGAWAAAGWCGPNAWAAAPAFFTMPLHGTEGGRAVLAVLRDWLRREAEVTAA